MLSLILLSACVIVVPKQHEAPPETGGSPQPCAEMDCQDALTLRVLDTDGMPLSAFTGALQADGGDPVHFSCDATPAAFSGGICGGDGTVTLFSYGSTYTGEIDIGIDDGPYWAGEFTPAWTAPYDSPECGHYCYIADESVQLVPCDSCG